MNTILIEAKNLSLLEKENLISLFESWPGFKGIEEFNLEEDEVDELLGERSFSGGNISEEILTEIESAQSDFSGLKCYFEKESISFLRDELLNLQKKTKLDISWSEIEETDWNAEWKKHFKKIEIMPNFHIIPSFEDSNLKESERIIIYPGMGFGTGNHETTFMCLQFLLELMEKEPIHSILDYGSGSGILGLSAMIKNHQASLDAVEIDPIAHENAKINQDLNNISPENIRWLNPDDKLKIHYDLILANILLPTLMEKKNVFEKCTKKNSKIILSGILNSQTRELLDYYLVDSHWKVLAEKTRGDWSAILLEKK